MCSLMVCHCVQRALTYTNWSYQCALTLNLRFCSSLLFIANLFKKHSNITKILWRILSLLLDLFKGIVLKMSYIDCTAICSGFSLSVYGYVSDKHYHIVSQSTQHVAQKVHVNFIMSCVLMADLYCIKILSVQHEHGYHKQVDMNKIFHYTLHFSMHV